MPRPTTRDELLAASEKGHAALAAMIDGMTPDQRQATFTFDDRDRCVRDVLVHLVEWQRMLLTWVESNEAGLTAPFLPQGYTWTTYAPLNIEFRDAHAGTSLEEARSLLEGTYRRVMAMIASHSDLQLFTKKHYAWTGTTSLGAYCVSATSSHYDWAAKKLRAHAKSSRAGR